MNPTRTITITRTGADGNPEQVEVRMLYCAASETGYQSLSGKTMDVFFPTYGKDDEGNVIVMEKPQAGDMDYIHLAVACIVAAYERDRQEPPITADNILYSASRQEIIDMVRAVVEMQLEWMKIPATISKEMEEKPDRKLKNAETPTKRSRRS